MDGWVKFYRQTFENPIVCKDAEHIAIWLFLLAHAAHTETDAIFNGKRITLHPGMLITGRKSIGEKLKIDEYKVQRVLSTFKNAQQIAQETSNKNRLITVINWEKFQSDELQTAQQLHNNCTTTAQQLHTNKNERNAAKNIKNNDNQARVREWLQTSCDFENIRNFYGDDGSAETVVDTIVKATESDFKIGEEVITPMAVANIVFRTDVGERMCRVIQRMHGSNKQRKKLSNEFNFIMKIFLDK